MNDSTACLIEEELEPFALIIFGATGDLAHRKLLPALFDLYISKMLPDHFVIIGCGRSDFDHESFKNSIASNLLLKDSSDKQSVSTFLEQMFYQKIDYNDQNGYRELGKQLDKLAKEFSTNGNTLFYFALPPSLYATVAIGIGNGGFDLKNDAQSGWSRMVIEKPFGHDLQSALELDQTLHKYFKEHQIFRIDHYLAKETVQNILLFRFANAIFEPVWNRQYIDHIHINAFESLGVEHRASYYEQAGVIRDMFQNHIMQLLSLTAMEPPARFETEKVRDEKSKVFSSLRPFDQDRLHEHVLLGQYGPGRLANKDVVGYRQEPGIKASSLTPTYAAIEVYIDNWRWQGVPFYLRSGKRMAEKRTEIIIHFREVPHSMLGAVMGQHITTNRLTITIAPEESINLSFQTKSPGPAICLDTVTMDFKYKDRFSKSPVDGYGKVLIECIQGDQLLFWRKDSIEKSWAFLTPILNCYEECEEREQMLIRYPAGSKRVNRIKSK